MTRSYPLHWPEGYPRTPARDRTSSKFKVKGDRATRELVWEIERNAKLVDGFVISTNVPIRNDGLPYANRKAPEDEGVAVYFTHRRTGKKVAFACDKYWTIAENMRAIQKTLEALRTVDRHGASQAGERVFTGFAALPPPKEWWQILDLDGPDVSRREIQDAHRILARANHPDRGGDARVMAEINEARDRGITEIEAMEVLRP